MTVEWTDWTDYTELNPPVISYGEYTPKSFTEFARDLANGCRTLTVVTIGDFSGNLLIEDGLSARIVRECEGGLVREVRRIRAWGNIIGREEEWCQLLVSYYNSRWRTSDTLKDRKTKGNLVHEDFDACAASLPSACCTCVACA